MSGVTRIEFAIHVVFYTTWKRKKRESTQRESAAATAQGCRIDNAHNNYQRNRNFDLTLPMSARIPSKEQTESGQRLFPFNL